MQIMKSLTQYWPLCTKPSPIVLFGAGSIVSDAHLPAYAKAGYGVAGIYDPDTDKARSLAKEWGCKAFASVQEAVAVEHAVFDLATPPAAHSGVLEQLPHEPT